MRCLPLTKLVVLTACALAGGCGPAAPTTAPQDADLLRKKEEAMRDKARLDVRALTTAVEVYHLKNGDRPPSLQALTRPQPDAGGPPLLSADQLTDPWGKPYQYDPAGPKHNGEKSDVWTQAPDGTVICNWQEKK